MCEKGKDFEFYTNTVKDKGEDKDGEYECWRTPPGNIGIINYRYLLKKEGKKPLIIIGCNPSKANEERLDRTMISVENFLINKEYDGYIMLNLYPQIASDVEALPTDITPHINHINHFHNINKEIIEDVLIKNNKSDILFAFGRLIEKREFLYNICYNHMRELLIKLIRERIIDNSKIKKLAKRNTKNKKIKTFSYPPHFSNREFNKKNVERIFDPVPFDFEAYHI